MRNTLGNTHWDTNADANEPKYANSSTGEEGSAGRRAASTVGKQTHVLIVKSLNIAFIWTL